ncbi:MAG: hypothetical protein ACO3EE_06860, partial [Flavobacteriales bacterium]
NTLSKVKSAEKTSINKTSGASFFLNKSATSSWDRMTENKVSESLSLIIESKPFSIRSSEKASDMESVSFKG